MVIRNFINTYIWIKLATRGYLRSPITNLNSTFINSECWIQDGEPKFKKLLYLDETWCSKVFEVADDESELKVYKLKMADLIWRIQI